MPDHEDEERDWAANDELGFVFDCAEKSEGKKIGR